MPPIINYKICDQAKECLGISSCKFGAFYFDEKAQKPVVDYSKCVNCGKCKNACEVGAIKFANSTTELIKIIHKISKDPRKRKDLLIDRYGAMPITIAFQMKKKNFDIEILQSIGWCILEIYSDDLIECLLHSIPIKDIFNNNMKYRKMKVNLNSNLLGKYNVKKLPALLFFKDGNFVGKIEGYYDKEKKYILKNKINKIIDQNSNS